ncbi:hypothetical protein LTS18_006170 [Coniosporium uncinatum]|uniref:Uncharacterized protein n=1 Tax=Coniosporium uncinatum TaxID=93489 RepID=A0ACC3DCZ0_9PEZI|nr:hypothetical protein LTS18_006170 [Coniosporium uncinatum]
MASPYVCMNCRHQLSRRSTRYSSPQWLLKAPFTSLVHEGTKKKAASDEKAYTPRRPRASAATGPDGQGKFGADQLAFLKDLPAPSGRYSRAYREPEPPTAGRRGVQAERRPPVDPVRHTNPTEQRSRVRETRVGQAARLKELLEDPATTPAQAWKHFTEHLGSDNSENVRQPALQDVAILRGEQFFGSLLAWMTDKWARQPLAQDIPRPTEVIDQLQIRRMPSGGYEDTIMMLAARAHNLRRDGCRTSQEYAALISELMGAWQRLFGRFSQQSVYGKPTGPNDWSCLPVPNLENEIVQGRLSNQADRSFLARFAGSLFDYPAKRKPSLSAAAAMTFDLLTDGKDVSQLQEQGMPHAPFIKFVAFMLYKAHYKPSLSVLCVSLQRQGVSQQEADAVSGRLFYQLSTRAVAIYGSGKALEAASGGGHEIPIDNLNALSILDDAIEVGDVESHIRNTQWNQKSPQAGLEDLFMKRLGRAVETQDPGLAMKLWQQAQSTFSEQKLTMPPRLFDHVILTMMAVRQPEAAIQVWNRMMQEGVQPTVRTWTAMLDGCGKSNDYVAMERCWQRMLASGIKPDLYAWTARISGLFRCNRPKDGQQAMQEMGMRWVAAEKAKSQSSTHAKSNGSRKTSNAAKTSPAEDSPCPDVVTLNAILSSVSRYNNAGTRQRCITEAFNWARTFQIRPDVITFNTLMQAAVRDSDIAEATELLKRMSSMSIAPDDATFTIFLTLLFRSDHLGGQSHEQQQSTVLNLLSEFESRGLKLTEYIYNIIINGLVRRYANILAGYALLSHMSDRHVATPARTYTIFLNYYLAQSPPDTDGVDALWERMRITGVTPDSRFYERMLEGYALASEIPRIVKTLTHMRGKRKAPTWQAWYVIAKCMARMEDWGRLEEVLALAREMGGEDTEFNGRARYAFERLVEGVKAGSMVGAMQEGRRVSEAERAVGLA